MHLRQLFYHNAEVTQGKLDDFIFCSGYIPKQILKQEEQIYD